MRHFNKKVREVFNRLDLKMAVKTSITAVLSLYVCLQLDSFLKHPDYLTAGLWCVVASIIVLQANIGGTYRAIWNRFLGVVIGSAIGALFTFTFGAEVESLAFAIFTTIVLCSFLGIPDSYRIASLSVVIIMIPWKLHPSSNPWIDAFFRFLDTSLGFLIAIVVSHVLWPSQALNRMRLDMAETFNLFRQFFEHLLIPSDSASKSNKISKVLLTEIDQMFVQSRSVLEESKVELMMRLAPIGIWVDLINAQERLWESFRALQSVFDSNLEKIFDESLAQQVKHTIEVIDFALKELALQLKTGESNFDFNILNHLQDSLQQELVRFRSTHTIKRYSLDMVENYFVFFYHIKHILKTLFHFNKAFRELNTSEQR